MKPFFIFVLVVFAFHVSAVEAAECTREEAISAEQNASTLRSWQDINIAFKRFGHCDDGAIAEGFSESVSALLASRWNHTDALQKLISKDQSFRLFVLRHLDESVPADRWSVIEGNAKDHCSEKIRTICQDVLTRSREISANLKFQRTPAGAPEQSR